MVLVGVVCNRELYERRQRRQPERQKVVGLISKTTTLQVHNAFLYISLPSLPMHECLKEARNATKFGITRINL